MLKSKFAYLFYHNKLASLQIELCIMQRCRDKNNKSSACENVSVNELKLCQANQAGLTVMGLSFYLLTSHRNVQCGTLQCKEGERQPVNDGIDQLYSRTIISIKGQEYECKCVQLDQG